MKRIALTLIMSLLMSGFLVAQNIKADKEAIKEVIQSAYVDGLQNDGDLAKVDAGFHPGFNLLGIGKGEQMWQLPIYNWKERVKEDLASDKKPRSGDELVNIKFLSVDIEGTAAVAKIEFYVGKTLTYYDFLSLYKFGNEWKIVSKIFYKVPEE